MSGVIETLKAECEYHELAEGPVDNLIEYKDALEDLVGRIDELMRLNSAAAEAEAWRRERGLGTLSASDVTGALFGMGFGEVA